MYHVWWIHKPWEMSDMRLNSVVRHCFRSWRICVHGWRQGPVRQPLQGMCSPQTIPRWDVGLGYGYRVRYVYMIYMHIIWDMHVCIYPDDMQARDSCDSEKPTEPWHRYACMKLVIPKMSWIWMSYHQLPQLPVANGSAAEVLWNGTVSVRWSKAWTSPLMLRPQRRRGVF